AALVQPLFVCHGEKVRRPVASMPGQAQLSVDEASREAEALAKAGVGGVILFGLPATKDPEGREAYDEKGIIPKALRALREAAPDLLLWADVCLCEYTDHGHCGILNGDQVDNDRTLPLLARASVAYAAAGADLIAPSDMMDGRGGSGEFARSRAAAENGWLDRERAALETLTSIRRAGADVILTYFAKEIAPVLGRVEA